jgi:SAM-dependent methyltransferase
MRNISSFALQLSESARRKRAALFRSWFSVDKNTRILDVGSENGTNISNVLEGSEYDPQNVFIADIDDSSVAWGRQKFGFNGVAIDEMGALPFESSSFDIVYCSSVIEHVTVRHEDIWKFTNGNDFRKRALEHQHRFADEIKRVGRNYFIQTPAAGFPVESHTWLPLAGYLPRGLLLPTMKAANRFWPKTSIPDFNLLNEKDLAQMFPEAAIQKETFLGLTKSLMAVKSDKR